MTVIKRILFSKLVMLALTSCVASMTPREHPIPNFAIIPSMSNLDGIDNNESLYASGNVTDARIDKRSRYRLLAVAIRNRQTDRVIRGAKQ